MRQRLFRSTIEDRVSKLAANYAGNSHEALLRLTFYLVTDRGYDDLEPEDLIDGAGEYQIDVLHIGDPDSENSACVTIIQGTNSDSLSSTRLIKLHAGLNYLLEQPKNAYSILMNQALADRIQEFRDLRAEILSSNICLQIFYVSLSDPTTAGREFNEQVNRIRGDYGDFGGEFRFEVLGPEQLFELLDRRERRGVKVNERLRIIYDQNKSNLLEHYIESVAGVICTIPATEIARIVNQHPTIFDENLRQYIGLSGSVNQAIHESCTNAPDAALFWFLNNGVTITCDHYEVHKDVDKSFVDVTNLQIVNGCQTSVTLAQAAKAGTLLSSANVLVRIFRTDTADLASKLVVTTNTQNKITNRDLRANEPIQKQIQSAFEQKMGLLYERKPNEFAAKPVDDQPKVISNERIGQSCLAILRRKPSDARRRKYKIWGEEYDRIFSTDVFPETYLLCYRIVEACEKRKRELRNSFEPGDVKRTIILNGDYHLARVVSFLWRGTDNWNELSQIQSKLEDLAGNPDLLNGFFDQALETVSDLVIGDEHFVQDVTTGLKANRIDDEIDKKLYSLLAATGQIKRPIKGRMVVRQ